MEDILTPTNVEITKEKTPLLRTLAIIFNKLANISAVALVLVIVGLVLVALVGSDIEVLFNKEGNTLSLGILGTLGVIIYVVVFVSLAVLIAVTVGFVKLNKNYTLVCKVYKNQPSTVFCLNKKSKTAIILSVVALVLLVIVFGLSALIFGVTNIYTLCMLIPAGLLIVAIIFAITDYAKGKSDYKKLSSEEQDILNQKSEELKTNFKKVKTKKRIGKIY